MLVSPAADYHPHFGAALAAFVWLVIVAAAITWRAGNSCAGWCCRWPGCGVRAFTAAQAPQPSEQRPPVNAAGHRVIEAKNWNGDLATKTVDLEPNGNSITGPFKGPNQSGGLEGSVSGYRIVLRTKTKHPLTFLWTGRQRYHDRQLSHHGKDGEFHAERTASSKRAPDAD